MNDMHEVWEHPQLKARGRWTEVDTPSGPIPALLPPGEVDSFSPRMDAVPADAPACPSCSARMILTEIRTDVRTPITGNTVPAPGTLALMGLVLAGLGVGRSVGTSKRLS